MTHLCFINFIESDACVLVTDDHPDPCIAWWVQELNLYEVDRETLIGNEELTDNIVNAAQRIMKDQFSQFIGFQNSILGINLKFKRVSRLEKSIQILHTGKHFSWKRCDTANYFLCCTGKSAHWICVSTDGTGLVYVLDSLSLFMSLNKHTAFQVAQIYSIPATRSLQVKRLSVQQQHGTLDCGVFSIAYAVEICSGRNPEEAHFNQK